MGLARKPKSGLAAEVLPPPLHRALTHVFAQGIDGAMLVGGTALAGYYAGHRRSDDLDLFTENTLAQKATVLSVKSIGELGSSLAHERSSARFYHATCRLDGHDFTAQVVLDSNLFAVGSGIEADDGVMVAGAETLLKMKAATLVSRASEKDLFDLAWFFKQDEQLDVPTLIALGTEIDGGMNGEALLISLVGTQMRKSACGFSLTKSPDEVLADVTRVQEGLIHGVESHLRKQPAPPLAALVRKLR
jgi:hypothetical protein